MKKNVLVLVLLVLVVASYQRAVRDDRIIRINGVALGDRQVDVEALHGPGSKDSVYHRLAKAYPGHGDEHSIRVFYNEDLRVIGSIGFELSRGDASIKVSQKLTDLIELVGQPKEVRLFGSYIAGTAEFRFQNELVVTTILNKDHSGRYFLPNYIGSMSLAPPPAKPGYKLYLGPIELRKLPESPGSLLIFQDGQEILNEAGQGSRLSSSSSRPPRRSWPR